MSYKICSHCEEKLPATAEYFFKQKLGKYGLRANCKECAKRYAKNYRSIPEHKERMKEYKKKYYSCSGIKERTRDRQREYESRPEVKERRKKQRSRPEYKKRHERYRREYQKKYFKNRKQRDIQFRLTCNLRGRLYTAIKNNYKSGSAVKDLGCSISELKLYLENQFKPGMSWENWTKEGWHIDHIKPLASFDLTDREQLLQACHYTNLQPLWAEDNLSKGPKVMEGKND